MNAIFLVWADKIGDDNEVMLWAFASLAGLLLTVWLVGTLIKSMRSKARKSA